MSGQLETVYGLLEDVYCGKSYSSIALSKTTQADPFVTRLFYGVLQKDAEFEYAISVLTEKRPKRRERTIIKIGFYLLKYMDTPDYAAISETVELARTGGLRNTGFVNAVLRRFAEGGLPVPKDKAEALAVRYSKPLWLVQAYLKQYRDKAEELLQDYTFTDEHIRPNTLKTDLKAIKQKLEECGISYTDDGEGGLFLKNGEEVRRLYGEGMLTFQSLCSVRVAKAAVSLNGKNILDLCAAPGGKSIYIAEHLKDCTVTACDIHPHRIALIESYKKRMGATNVKAVQADATEYIEEFEEAFDTVLADVPCSGIGVAHKKPDILLNRTFKDVEALAELQYKILCNAYRYLKEGGTLIYSTCTTLREENRNVTGRFLKEMPSAEKGRLDASGADGWDIQYLPDGRGQDGFYAAAIKKPGERG